MKKISMTILFGLMLLGMMGEKAVAADGKLIIGIIPEINLTKQMERFLPLCKYLGKKIGMEVGVKPMANYGLIYEDIRDDKIEAGFFGSFTFGMTYERLGIEPLARPEKPDGTSTYTGLTFVRKDSGIKGPEDMKGKTIALVDKLTTAGYLAQVIYFKEHGIDIEKDVKIFWTGSHDAAIEAVLNKQADMGGAKNLVFDKMAKGDPDIRNTLIVLNESPSVPDNTFAVDKELDPEIKSALEKALIDMGKDDEGMKILRNFGAARFIDTEIEDFRNLFSMVKEAGFDMKTYPYEK
jgi:phosphonate transport system substrate-binding protein